MARLSVVFLSFAIFQLTWGLDISHSKYGSLSPGIVPSPVALNNFYRMSSSDLMYPNFEYVSPVSPSLFDQILLHELFESGKASEVDLLPQTDVGEGIREDGFELQGDEIKIDVKESIEEDMHDFDRFFSL